MAIRSDKIKGGNNYTNGEVLYDYDLDDTNDYILDAIGTGHAQNAYQTLQANNVFENKDFLAADEMTDSTGTNNTVNTGSSTALFDSVTPSYKLGYTDEASGDTTHDPDSFTDAANAFDNNDGTLASKTTTTNATYALGKTFGSKFVGFVKIRGAIATTGSSTCSLLLQTYDGATWTTHTTLYASSTTDLAATTYITYVNSTVQGIRAAFVNGGSAESTTMSVYTVEYGNFDLSSTVVCDTGIKTLGGTEKTIWIYADKTTPTNTSMNVDITDGVTTLSAKAYNTAIPLTGFTSGTLAVTHNLITTDTSVTPTLRGYSIYIK